MGVPKSRGAFMENIRFFEITPKPLILAQYDVLKCDIKSYILHPMSF